MVGTASPPLLTCFLALLFMALSTFLPTPSPSQKHQRPPPKRKRKQPPKPPSSWDQIKNLLSCNQIESSQVHDPSKNLGYSKLGSSCNSICSFRDVVHGNTRVIHREENSPESSSLGQETGLLRRNSASVGSSRSGSSRSSGPYSSSSRGMQLRKLSGCYECHMIVDPSRYPSARSSFCACSECGEIFAKAESLEIHQAVRHAVSELGPEDSGRNIVEIIFKSSWLKKDTPIFHIDRILKVHNTPRTVGRFEDYRASVKARASSHTHNRCAADGNELLRFHCSTITCALGARGSSSLCGSGHDCGVCTVIRHGFVATAGGGVRTTASSGRAHDSLLRTDDGKRAMLVCRVIAGRVKRVGGEAAEATGCWDEESATAAGGGMFDSVAGHAGMYSNLEELTVFNPRAILPCFVVIYRATD